MKKIIHIFILLFSINSFSQQEASKWYFGRNAALDFSSGNPIPISGSELNTDEGCSSFADSSGNLLFYIGANLVFPNNLTVWDRNDNPMPNASPALGTGLEGDVSSSQAALTVPAPGSPNLFYIFTLGAASSGNSGFFYYELDMTLNGGLGDVSAGPFDLSDGLAVVWSEKVTAVKGDACNTFWVISFVQDRFYAYLVDATGVAISSPVISVLSTALDVRGYLKVSPDGTKLVSANMGSGTFLYDFDNVTGVVSNPQALNLSGNTGYGVEFSLSSQKLYISTGDFASGSQENLYQFDVSLSTIADINTSRELIHTYINARGALQMASNGKIYRASRDSARISVINNPEETGAASNYSHQTVDLGGPISSDGLPPFISSLLLPLEITESGSTVPLNNQIQNLCNGTDITFTPEPVAGSPTYVWTFDNGTSVVELSNGSSPNLTLTTINNTNNGIYKLTVTVIDECGIPTTLEGEFTIEVFDQPTAVQPSNMVQCDDDNNGTMPFMLTDQDAIINTDAGMNITYYLSQAEADAGTTGALSSPFETGSTTIFARVENDLNTPCYDTTFFDLEVYATAFPSTTVSLLATCDNDSAGTDTDGFILFNLHDRATEILNGQLVADFTLTYFIDAAFTTQIPVADETAFTNTVVGGQTIFVRMTNNLNTAICFADTSFEIEVFELPVLLTNSITLIQCNDDLTLIEAFNLRLKESEISADFSSETFTYYETSAEADAGVAGTEIPNPTTYPNQIAGFDTVWVRVETINGCHRVAQVDLDVNPSSAVMTGFITQIFSECDDPANTTDVVSTFDFSSVTTNIQALFAPLVVDVLYYETEAQANLGLVADQLDATNYDNITQDQLIWVQIVSDFGSDCLAKGQYVQLHVEELPTANKPTDLTECDDDQDGIFPFDVSNVEAEILGGQSLTDVTITYFNEDGTLIGTSLPNPFSTISQTIDIVATNNVTNDPDGACSNATTLIFTVDALPINEVQPIAPLCETDPEDGLLIATFDTSNLESSVNAQAGMEITYLDASGDPLLDMDGNLIVSPFPSSFTTETQTITVVVTNPINTTCPSLATVEFIVNPRPVFDVIEEDIVCENILPHTITVENPEAVYTYEWFNSLGTPIGTGLTLNISNTDDITVEGVDYTIIATNPITNCEREKTFTLRKSSIATLLDEDIVTVEFNSPANSIEIITTNLGSGDYEFSLQHDADSRPWQDEPIFTDLQGGMYTILINDKNVCGEISKELFLLDYPKFLTPNNDGYNDYWQLIGLDSSTFTISPIQIFDRFGKIVALIDPTQGQGWDGLYNNEMLPSSDYWFVLSLTNNQDETIIKKGHFSLVRR